MDLSLFVALELQPEKCVQDLAALNQTYFCNVPNHLYDHIETPLFIVEAITDAVIMCGFEGLPCDPSDLLIPQVRLVFFLPLTFILDFFGSQQGCTGYPHTN